MKYAVLVLAVLLCSCQTLPPVSSTDMTRVVNVSETLSVGVMDMLDVYDAVDPVKLEQARETAALLYGLMRDLVKEYKHVETP